MSLSLDISRTNGHHLTLSEGKEMLFLCHRIPFPPNKGDKIRSYHILRHLSQQGWRIHLGTLADDPEDMAYQDMLRPLCASIFVAPVSGWRKLRAPWGALKGTSLSVECFRNGSLQHFVNRVLATGDVSAAVVVSAPMAEYLRSTGGPLPPRMILDLVDVDSEKWREYAKRDPWPMSWVYGLEARLLSRYERLAGDVFGDVALVSDAEADVFRSSCGNGCRVWGISNGVDHTYFSPDGWRGANIPGRMVFCGAMDYPPNIDAVTWFAKEVFPILRQRLPQAEFWIVGAKPAPAVLALADEPNIRVTGAVEDVRPFVASAALSVAPMRVARGLQNKVLEAMAMGKAVLATPQAFEGIEADPDLDLSVAPPEAEAFARAALELLTDEAKATAVGERARQRVEQRYSWGARLASLDDLLA